MLLTRGNALIKNVQKITRKKNALPKSRPLVAKDLFGETESKDLFGETVTRTVNKRKGKTHINASKTLDFFLRKEKDCNCPEPDERTSYYNDCFAFYLPINTIFTDENRFQNRTELFSEDSARAVAENFDINKFDPISVWKDPANGKIYVLSGHSRLAGMKMRKATTIPAKFYDGTEQQAINFARVEANRGGTPESLIEDLKAYKLLRDGDEAKGIAPKSKKEIKDVFKSKTDKLEMLSHLDTGGRFIQLLSAPNPSEFPFVERLATWTGAFRKQHGAAFTDTWEQDTFWWLYAQGSNNYKKDRNAFDEEMRKRIFMYTGKQRLFPECSASGCQKIRDVQEIGEDKEMYKELIDLEKKIRDLIAELGKAGTREEKDYKRRLISEYEQDADNIRKGLEIKAKTQVSLF